MLLELLYWIIWGTSMTMIALFRTKAGLKSRTIETCCFR